MALVCEAVTAVPSTGGAVTSMLTVGVGIVITAVLDVARTRPDQLNPSRTNVLRISMSRPFRSPAEGLFSYLLGWISSPDQLLGKPASDLQNLSCYLQRSARL